MAGFLGKVGFLEDTLGGIDIRQIQSGGRVAGVEDRSQSYSRLEWSNHDPVHFIINNMACGTEIDRVNDFVVTIVFITVQIGRLTTVT